MGGPTHPRMNPPTRTHAVWLERVSYDDELDAHGRERLGVLYTYLLYTYLKHSTRTSMYAWGCCAPINAYDDVL